MDQQKIGRFLAQARKEKSLTQEQLAETLGVSNRTISRWENGKNMPDVSLFQSICTELGITMEELLDGERKTITEPKSPLPPDAISEAQLQDYTHYLRRRSRRKIVLLALIVAAFLCMAPIFVILACNKTFFGNTYHSDYLDNVYIQVPTWSFYRKTGGMETYFARFKTLRQNDDVNVFIDQYLATLEEIQVGEYTYYYHPTYDFTIFSYRINNDGIGFVNTIYIGYHDGYYDEPYYTAPSP